MAANPFTKFKNFVATFEVDDPLMADAPDRSGNPQPAKREVSFEAFMKPARAQYGLGQISDQFPGIGFNSERIEGYVVTGNIPSGINPGDRSVYAQYRNQVGTFIPLIKLQSSVEADTITGAKIVGIFQVLGGQ